MNAIQNVCCNFFTQPSKVTLGSSVFCLMAAGELGIRAICNFNDSDKLSSNLAGCFVMTLTGFNLIPGTARLGALGFYIFSLAVFEKDGDNRETCWISHAVAMPSKTMIWPMLEPIITRVKNFVNCILKKIQWPENPLWYIGTALLIGAVVYNYQTLLAFVTANQFASVFPLAAM